MSDLIPNIQTLIGLFMIATGIALTIITTQMVKNHNKR